ncbi:MAG: hypothetical protein KME45_03170 [Stenomitos rutilans HA7619-LM2]|jgi:hypothetical protein|nr:hypothetical protein [Stenomitos rutilans HA7619-LM2]MBW4469386.1 hypothetical protein [Stenomitos rutilans HA7619-LM2]
MLIESAPGGGSTHSEQIYLTVDCFKSLAMMAGTDRGKEVRQYFLNCERDLKSRTLAPTQPLSELEALQIAVGKLVEQERRVRQLEAAKEQADQRLSAIEAEQDRYQAPCGHKYTVLAYASLNKLELSRNGAAVQGKRATALCRQQQLEIEQIYDPRFGKVNIYPQSILEQVFTGVLSHD